jgi:hypothetical protein
MEREEDAREREQKEPDTAGRPNSRMMRIRLFVGGRGGEGRGGGGEGRGRGCADEKKIFFSLKKLIFAGFSVFQECLWKIYPKIHPGNKIYPQDSSWY